MQYTKLYVLLYTCNMLKREWMDTIVLFVCCVWRTDVSWDNYYYCWCSCSVVNSKVQRNWTMSSSEQFPNYSFSQLVLSVARTDKQVQLKTVVKWTTKLWLYIQYSTYVEKSQIENEQTHFLRFIFIFFYCRLQQKQAAGPSLTTIYMAIFQMATLNPEGTLTLQIYLLLCKAYY